jgi:cytochrome c553
MSRQFFPAAAALTLAVLAPAAAADSFWSWAISLERHKEVAPVTLKAWADECSSCHYAYPPGLLPAASWQKLLTPAALEKHFGENIEMKDELRLKLLDYANANAAEHSMAKRSRKMMASLNGAAPERITEAPYIKRKHQDIPKKLVQDNPQVKALSQCDTCHTEAKTGNLDDDTVTIPGHGRWR